MKKQEFLDTLRKKLSILEESEIEDIISEYDGYIEEKIAKGSTEEEAVKSMGNVGELAKDLLSAYKVKNPEEKKYDSFNHLADGFMRVFDRIIEVFSNKSLNEILRFVMEIIVIFLIIGICKMPFSIIEGLGRDAFYSLGHGTFRILGNIWEFILDFIYLIFAVLLFIKIFESRYLKNMDEGKSYERKEKSSIKEKKEKNVIKEEKDEMNKRQRNYGVVDTLADLFMLFVKMIVFFILIGVVCYNIGMAITVGVSFYMMIKGIFYFGIYLILFSLLALGIVAFIFLYNFIFNRKNKTGLLLIISLVSFLLFGIGIGITAIEFANTTIIYNQNSDRSKKEAVTYDMEENLVLGWDMDDDHIHIDDTMDKKIKIEYSYDDTYYKIVAKPYINRVREFVILHPNYNVQEFKYSKELFNKFLNDLKHKTIHFNEEMGVGIDIYMSKNTYEKLILNQNKYEKMDFDYEDIYDDVEDICEELNERGSELPNYCHYNGHHNNM